MFPGAQPRVNNADFVFRCMSCNCETNLDESLNGECAACSGVVHLSYKCKMSHEEVARRKKRKKLMRRAKLRLKHERSTTVKGDKRVGSVAITFLVGTVIVLLAALFVTLSVTRAESQRQADQLLSLELQAHSAALQAMRERQELEAQREAAEQLREAENAAGLERARQVRAELASSTEEATRLIEEADRLLEEAGFQEGE